MHPSKVKTYLLLLWEYISASHDIQVALIQGVQDPNLKLQITRTQKLGISDPMYFGKSKIHLAMEFLFEKL